MQPNDTPFPSAACFSAIARVFSYDTNEASGDFGLCGLIATRGVSSDRMHNAKHNHIDLMPQRDRAYHSQYLSSMQCFLISTDQVDKSLQLHAKKT
jgi:hypothetical protein